MKLSRETQAILKNFSSINQNILLKPGNKLSTVSVQKNIMSDAAITESFDTTFGIYDISEFLGAVSLFNDPELTFNDKYVTISEGNNSIKYFSAEEKVLTVPTKEIKFPSVDIEFELTSNLLEMINKTASVLKSQDLSLIGDGSKIVIRVGDKKVDSANVYEVEVGSTDLTFTVNLKIGLLKLIHGDYTVSISTKKISRFQHKTKELVYFLAVESDSSFA
jgi:hypothetical protein